MIAAGLLAPQEPDGRPRVEFDAGRLSDFAPASVHYFSDQHFYLVRSQGGEFVALYDWGGWPQRRFREGDESKADCRVVLGLKEPPALGNSLDLLHERYGRVTGLENVLLTSSCDGSSFDALGRFGFGPAGSDLDRFEVRIGANGHVLVDLANRRCGENSPCLAYR